jgi:hypothetical protein
MMVYEKDAFFFNLMGLLQLHKLQYSRRMTVKGMEENYGGLYGDIFSGCGY